MRVVVILLQVSDRFLWGDAASTCLETLLFSSNPEIRWLRLGLVHGEYLPKL